MILKLPMIDRVKWADDQVVDGSSNSTAAVEEDSRTGPLFLGINYTKPLTVANPMYGLKCSEYSGPPVTLLDLPRPAQWEPELYHGKPGTILTPAKAVLIIRGESGGSLTWPYPVINTTDYEDALDMIQSTVADLGVHMYSVTPRNDAQWLVYSIPHGGRVAGAYGDECFGIIEPPGYAYGELLVIHFPAHPDGFPNQPPSLGQAVGSYNAGLLQSVTVRLCANASAASYYGINAGVAFDSPMAIANDQAIAAEFIDNRIDRFRHVLHVVVDASITQTYSDGLSPVPKPGGYPGTAHDVFNAVTTGLNGFQIGSDISPFATVAELAALILADIEDFFS